MLWVTGTTGEVEFVNRACREFFAITPEAASEGVWRSLIHPDDASEYLAAFDKAIKERASLFAEARSRRGDG